jgi:hypothetical protein
VVNLCRKETRVGFYCVLERRVINKLMNKTKDLAYFIRQSLNSLPKFVIARIRLALTKFDFIIYTHIVICL